MKIGKLDVNCTNYWYSKYTSCQIQHQICICQNNNAYVMNIFLITKSNMDILRSYGISTVHYKPPCDLMLKASVHYVTDVMLYQSAERWAPPSGLPLHAICCLNPKHLSLLTSGQVLHNSLSTFFRLSPLAGSLVPLTFITSMLQICWM